MSSMGWVALLTYAVLCLGPLRRAFWANWRFWLPGSVGGWLGWYIGRSIRLPSEPAWVPAVFGLLVGIGVGVTAKRWLDEALGERR